jgi:hypothetical protein
MTQSKSYLTNPWLWQKVATVKIAKKNDHDIKNAIQEPSPGKFGQVLY